MSVFVSHMLKSIGCVWFCLMVLWYLAELQESGMQFADPVLPCFSIAIVVGSVYSGMKNWRELNESSSQVSSSSVF